MTQTPSKTRVELRLDSDLHTKIKALADEADISVNQLIQGVMRWAMRRANVGEAEMLAYDHIDVTTTPGCVWFGNHRDVVIDEDGNEFLQEPELIFQLDFTERNVVRED